MQTRFAIFRCLQFWYRTGLMTTSVYTKSGNSTRKVVGCAGQRVINIYAVRKGWIYTGLNQIHAIAMRQGDQ